MNVIQNNWNNSKFLETKADIYISNKVFHLNGENYSKYIYPIFNELTYSNSIERLYSLILDRNSKEISFDEFFCILNKLSKQGILILFEDDVIYDNDVLNCSIVDFSYTGISKKIEENFSIKVDIYISNSFLKENYCINELNLYNFKNEVKSIKNNEIIVLLVNRNNFDLIKSTLDIDLNNNKYILPVIIDSNVMIIGSLISRNIDIFEKEALIYQLENVFRKYILKYNYFVCSDNFLISSLGILIEEIKKVKGLISGFKGLSKIVNNMIIYNFITGKIYYEKVLKYRNELERILGENE